jgi:hypothetical protein
MRETAMSAPQTVTVYAVERCCVDELSEESPEEQGRPAVACFLSFEKADVHCRDLERQQRREHNPFRWRDDSWSRDNTAALVRRLRSRLEPLGVELPLDNSSRQDLDRWWKRQGPHLTDRQVDRVWEVVTDHRFFTFGQRKVKLDGRPPPKITHLFLVEKLVGGEDGAARPVRAFLAWDRAEAFYRRREDAAWQRINPFLRGKLAEWTSLDAGRLRDWMLDLGLEPPAGEFHRGKWGKWFAEVQPTLSPAQRWAIREAMDRRRFFRIVELSR